ncbi:hypothetical protein SKAU_G00013170 [Synaphobranchus kaupii]|uniref:Uncharacterized protein n=1 Tax=Synaphobranchus kaupii TaxID=118154 RepID=A0A9Q1GAF7_SYNKA|nr:hypothetical protein SKAU_G00013170 [Synaphobranchus kaupii]
MIKIQAQPVKLPAGRAAARSGVTTSALCAGCCYIIFSPEGRGLGLFRINISDRYSTPAPARPLMTSTDPTGPAPFSLLTQLNQRGQITSADGDKRVSRGERRAKHTAALSGGRRLRRYVGHPRALPPGPAPRSGSLSLFGVRRGALEIEHDHFGGHRLRFMAAQAARVTASIERRVMFSRVAEASVSGLHMQLRNYKRQQNRRRKAEAFS